MSISYVNAQQSGLSPDLQKIIWASHFVINNYVDTVNEKEFADEAIAAMLQSLDPHSSYIPKEEVEKANEGLRGDFDGIGVTFQMLEDTMVVICPARCSLRTIRKRKWIRPFPTLRKRATIWWLRADTAWITGSGACAYIQGILAGCPERFARIPRSKSVLSCISIPRCQAWTA